MSKAINLAHTKCLRLAKALVHESRELSKLLAEAYDVVARGDIHDDLPDAPDPNDAWERWITESTALSVLEGWTLLDYEAISDVRAASVLPGDNCTLTQTWDLLGYLETEAADDDE